jgi:predicted nucleic acid-binding Zn ribbon protein
MVQVNAAEEEDDVSATREQRRTRKIVVWMLTILPLILLWLWLGRVLVDWLVD